MAVDYTTTALINSVKRRITVPTSQNFFLPSNIVEFATDELSSTMVPAIVSVREEYFVTTEDVTLISTENEYRLPTRAVGGMLRDVVMIDPNGNEVGIPRLQPETIKAESSLSAVNIAGIVMQDDKVIFYPDVKAFTQFTMRFKFMRRPNDLIITSQAGKILNINTGTNEVTLSNAPTAWTTSTTFDIIQGTPTFSSIQDDQTITNIAGAVLTFSALPAKLDVGQWVAEAGLSPIPQIPVEGFRTLAQYTAGRMLESTGDKKNAEIVMTQAQRLMDGFLKVLTPRIEGAYKKINTRTGIFNYTGAQPYEYQL